MMTMMQLSSRFYVADLDEDGDGHNDDDADDKDDDHAIDLSDDDDDDTAETDYIMLMMILPNKNADVTTVLSACADPAFVRQDLPPPIATSPGFV